MLCILFKQVDIGFVFTRVQHLTIGLVCTIFKQVDKSFAYTKNKQVELFMLDAVTTRQGDVFVISLVTKLASPIHFSVAKMDR